MKYYHYYVNGRLAAKGKCAEKTGLPRSLKPSPVEGNTLRITDTDTAGSQWYWYRAERWAKMINTAPLIEQCPRQS